MHERVVQTMRDIYLGASDYRYLNERAQSLLAEGREAFCQARLHERRIVGHEGKYLVFPWRGGRESLSLALALAARGLKAAPMQLSIEVEVKELGVLEQALQEIAQESAPDAVDLALQVPDRVLGKYDIHLSDRLQALNFARARLSTEAIPKIAADVLGKGA